VLVDGGYSALVAVESSRIKQQNKGNFVVEKRDDWLVSKEELKKLIQGENTVIIDSRSPREYRGRNPHGETRGGHIPGAINLHYREFLDPQGKLLSRETILAELAAKGVSPEAQIVIYCTGGIRSAWLTVVLVDLGFNAQNYAGSMWEWSAGDEREYPLLSKD
jgi:thiosulfate/3-mercaptopyruvate sulfurtransferase